MAKYELRLVVESEFESVNDAHDALLEVAERFRGDVIETAAFTYLGNTRVPVPADRETETNTKVRHRTLREVCEVAVPEGDEDAEPTEPPLCSIELRKWDGTADGLRSLADWAGSDPTGEPQFSWITAKGGREGWTDPRLGDATINADDLFAKVEGWVIPAVPAPAGGGATTTEAAQIIEGVAQIAPKEVTFGHGSYGLRCPICMASDYFSPGTVQHKDGCLVQAARRICPAEGPCAKCAGSGYLPRPSAEVNRSEREPCPCAV